MIKKKPIICKNCGRKVGFVNLKMRFQLKIIFWACVVAIITQVIGQIISDAFFKYLVG